MKNKISAWIAATLLTTTLVHPVKANEVKIFTDVPTNHYVYKEIVELVDRGVVNGFSDGTFKPNNKVNRAEFASFVARSLNLPKANSNFKDVPKSAALYGGVSSAYKAGIIKGFSNGTFQPQTTVNRQDMAVMLDRALQVKGEYTGTKKLTFSDSSKIGAYAKKSVERLYNYNVMGAVIGTEFRPTSIGNRAETARYIYNTLTVLENGKVEEKPQPPAINKHYYNMTLNELKNAYPQYEHVLVRRLWKPEMKIVETDMMKEYYDELHDPMFKGNQQYINSRTPEKWFKGALSGLGESSASEYMYYPMRETIAYNGKSYKNSPLMPKNFILTSPAIYEQMPEQPKETGKFLIDIHRYDDDFVVYQHENVKWDVLGETPLEIKRTYPKGNEYIVDLYTTFKYATGVTMAKGGLAIANNGKKILLENGSKQAVVNGKEITLSEVVSVKGGRAFGPVREIAEHIGLSTRVSHQHKRFEIANYPLEHKIGLWLE